MNKKNIRLLFLLKDLDLGGAEKSTINFSNYLAEKVDFLSIIGTPGFYSSNNITNPKIQLFTNFYTFSSIFQFINNVLKISRIIKKNKINIVHYHYRIFIPYIYLIKLFFPKLIIVYTHHSYYQDYITNFLYADQYLAISSIIKNDLQQFSFRKRNITIFNNGINVPGEINKKKQGQFNLAVIGRFDEQKGIKFIINFFNQNKLLPDNINLIFRGSGPLTDYIKQSCKNNDKIKLFVPQTETSKIYEDVDVLLVPSIFTDKKSGEGVPMIILEAMSYGIPVIASDIGGIKDVIKNNYNGLLFSQGNKEELQTLLLSLIKENELYKKLAKMAEKQLKTTIQLKKTRKNLLKHIKDY